LQRELAMRLTTSSSHSTRSEVEVGASQTERVTMADTVLPRESVTPSGVAQSQLTPEEIAEGLSKGEANNIRFIAKHGRVANISARMVNRLHALGLATLRAEDYSVGLTDLGRAVADVLAKRGGA